MKRSEAILQVLCALVNSDADDAYMADMLRAAERWVIAWEAYTAFQRQYEEKSDG